MTHESAMNEAARALSESDLSGSELCAVLVDALPVDRAAISTLRSPFEIETVGVSDPTASVLDEFQLDLGEGPCWDSISAHAPVILPHLSAIRPGLWPAFTAAIASYGVTGIYAFPLTVGTLDIGAIDLYDHTGTALSDDQLSGAAELAGMVALQVMRHALAHRDDDAGLDGPYSRREVHQATGMIIAQMRVSPSDALLLLRAHAYAAGRTVRETAADVVARTITFTD